MLKNYYNIDENLTIEKFLKDFKEKKISHYILLKDNEYYINIRNLALKYKNPNEKLKNYKIKIPTSKGKTKLEYLKDLYYYGERLIKTKEGIFDFLDGLKVVKELKPEFLNKKFEDLEEREIFVLTEKDKIGTARKILLDKRINILPIVDNNLSVIGEIRPFDFLVADLFDDVGDKNFYDKNKENTAFNLSVVNISNKRPITIDKKNKIEKALDILINKKLPSLIVTEGEKIYNIITYKDIFNLMKGILETPNYKIEYSGANQLLPEDFDIIQDFSERFMNKITKYSNYKLLKTNFKVIGENNETTKRKFIIRANLSYGNHVITVEKEIKDLPGEEVDFEKTRWNIPTLFQEVLKALEKKVNEETRKK